MVVRSSVHGEEVVWFVMKILMVRGPDGKRENEAVTVNRDNSKDENTGVEVMVCLVACVCVCVW